MQKMQTTNQEYNVAMVVSCCQVKRCVVSHVSCINANTTTHKHFNNVVPAHHRRPMQQTKPVLISTMFTQKLTISSQQVPSVNKHYLFTIYFLPARCYASEGNRDRNVSVCLPVRHAPVLCQNKESQRHDFFTIWQPHDSSFLTPNFITKF